MFRIFIISGVALILVGVLGPYIKKYLEQDKNSSKKPNNYND
jgi:hypothetical protein